MTDTLITAPILVTLDDDLGVISDGAVLVRDNRIAAVGAREKLLAGFTGRRIDTTGVLMPGLINAHTHLYSAFARGISIPGPAPTDFPEILERLWWRLDRCLQPKDVYTSALLGVLDAARWGVTCVFDHHASPNAVDGSLDEIARAFSEVGLRGVLCYEISDRDGDEIARQGLKENERFCRRVTDNNFRGRLAATVGVHASFTVSDATLEAAIGLAHEMATGIHVHVAEHPCDPQHAQQHHQSGVIERLHALGGLGERTIAAHCIHLGESELPLLRDSHTLVTHQPQSNMNNAVGVLPIERFLTQGIVCGIGSDGMTANIGEEFRVADLLHKNRTGDPRMGWQEVSTMALVNNREFVRRFFGVAVGILAPGALADITVKQYQPYTALTADNFWGHFLFAIAHQPAELTMVDGELVYHRGEFTRGVDPLAVARAARPLADELWRRFRA